MFKKKKKKTDGLLVLRDEERELSLWQQRRRELRQFHNGSAIPVWL